ncbi:MAG: hypothetical protein ACFFBC_00030 [Promethearchaeota archaeon]
MAIDGIHPNFELPTKNKVENDLVIEVDTLSDKEFFHLIVVKINPKFSTIAKNQLNHYFNQIKYHPERISIYIKKIKQLIKLEMKGVKNE